jgi:hypothetical protein
MSSQLISAVGGLQAAWYQDRDGKPHFYQESKISHYALKNFLMPLYAASSKARKHMQDDPYALYHDCFRMDGHDKRSLLDDSFDTQEEARISNLIPWRSSIMANLKAAHSTTFRTGRDA